MTSRRWLLLILIMAAVLRCVGIQSRSINYDDAFSFFLAQQSLADIVRGTAADTMPPLYYFLLHFWLQISTELWWLRVLSILLSLGAVGLTYTWVGGLAGTKAGLLAAAFTAVSPFQIYHAQDLRMYALLGTCQLGYFVFLGRLWQKGMPQIRKWDWAGLILFGTAAMYSHNLAIFGLAAANLFLLIRREWKKLWALLGAQVVIGLLALPWLWLVPGQVEKIQRAFWTPRPGITDVIQAVLVFTVHLPLEGVWLTLGMALSLLVLGLTVYETWLGRKKGGGLALLAVVSLGLPAMLFITSYIIRPVFVPRGFILASFAYYGLIGAAAARRWTQGMGKVLAAAFLLAALLSLPFFYRFESFPRSPFRTAVAALQSQVGAGEVVLHDNKLSYFPMHYFAPGFEQKFLADEAGSSNDTYAPASQQAMRIFPEADLESAVDGARGVYFVTFSVTLAEYQSMGLEQHPVMTKLQKTYQLADQDTYGDLVIFHLTQKAGTP